MSTSTLALARSEHERTAAYIGVHANNEPERRVFLTMLDARGRTVERAETHEAVALVLAQHADDVAAGRVLVGASYALLAARTAVQLVLSDRATGGSLAVWPEPRALVDAVLAHAYGAAVVSSEWEGF